MIDFIYPEWVLIFSEVSTVLVAAWLAYEAGKLALFFISGEGKIAQLLKTEFVTDLLQALVTLAMGVGLLLNDTFFVQSIVVLRPWVLLLNIYALRKLLKHYKRVR